MSKENKTAASMAHKPEEMMPKTDAPHAHSYPGRKTPKGEKVTDAMHDESALKEGKSNSMGESKDGSHKGIPCSKEIAGDCSM
jgi:hypothetical protein